MKTTIHLIDGSSIGPVDFDDELGFHFLRYVREEPGEHSKRAISVSLPGQSRAHIPIRSIVRVDVHDVEHKEPSFEG